MSLALSTVASLSVFFIDACVKYCFIYILIGLIILQKLSELNKMKLEKNNPTFIEWFRADIYLFSLLFMKNVKNQSSMANVRRGASYPPPLFTLIFF